MDAKPGDLIRIRLSDRELECTLLESYDSSILLVKLSSGYNIGIPKENVFDIEVISSPKVKKTQKSEPVTRDNLPSIGLVIVGGTIASKLDAKTGGVSPMNNVDDFASVYPELFEMVNIKKIEVPFMKLSENMNSEDWISLATSVHALLQDPDIQGVVIAHGTDFLHYSSSALSFFLGNVNKPVVFTYAMKSIDRASSDAHLNLSCAARFALSDCAEVVIVGHASINDDYCYALRGTRVRKLHSSRRDAFKSININPIAKVFPDSVEFLESYSARKERSSELDAVFNDKVALVKFYPGQSPDLLDYYRMHGFKGVVIEAAGIGNLATDEVNSWIPSIKRAIRDGVVVCAASQTIYGRLHPEVYSTGREMEKIGVIFLKDMLSETALVKLGWALGHRSWKQKIKEKMLENISGEFSHLLTY